VQGSRPEQNRYLLNGTDAGTTFGTSPVSASGIMMGVQGLQEFKVLIERRQRRLWTEARHDLIQTREDVWSPVFIVKRGGLR
jgi:hypothetical protein